MRVMHLLQSSRFSGAENVVCQIIKLFEDQPEVEMVYCSPNGQIAEVLKERGINYFPLKKLNNKEVKKAIKFIKPTIIHAHDRTAGFYASMASSKIPVVAHMHVNNNKGVKLLLRNFLWTISAIKFKHIFWVSNSSFAQFPFHKLLDKKSSVLYNVLSKENIIDRCLKDCNEYLYDLAFVGRLTYQKNPEKLLNILRKIAQSKEDIHVAIVGDGEYSNYVKKYIANNNLQDIIDYKGYVQNPLKIIKDSKMLILTSRFEGTPMVAIESLVLGTPIISTPVDGMKEIIVPDVNGFFAESEDDFVIKILETIDDTEKIEVLRKGAMESVKNFTDTNSFRSAIEEVYKRIENGEN